MTRRLATAVAVALAVTAGAGALTPAMAAPAATGTGVTAGLPQETSIGMPANSELRGGGPSGFLTMGRVSGRFSWTRYADGTTVDLPAGKYRGSVGSDIVVKENSSTSYELYDMATGADPVTIDTAFPDTFTKLLRTAGKTLVMQVLDGSGNAALHLVSKEGDEVVDREVAGLPADADFPAYDLSEPDVFALVYTGTVGGVTGKRLAVVDLATGTITDDRAVPRASDEFSASATHVAWSETDAEGRLTVVTARQGETATVRTPAGTGGRLRVDLMGDWVTYSMPGGADATEPNPLYALMARPLTGGTAPVKVMDSTKVAYGSEQVQGGTVAHGEGVYRIAPGADGRPVATLRASSGEATALGLTGQEVPATLGFRTNAPQPSMIWYLDRGNAWVHAEITHKATGKRWTSPRTYPDGGQRYVTSWDGAFDDYTAARNGAYTWKLIAEPRNGIGPVLVRTGTFTVASGTAPHDYSDSGSPDLLVRNDAGRLYSFDFRQILSQLTSRSERTDHGAGWNTYDRVVATGDVAGSPYADVLGRDRTGALWFYQGTGTSLARRTWVGGGWQAYDKLAGGSDLTGDGRADLVAADRSGVLWLYASTGNAAKPFETRRRIGGGWGIYNKITAAGNIAGGRAGDLVARDEDGVLWLYQGNGNGGFTTRVKVGGGWQAYKEIIGIGDADRDGHPDLLVDGLALYRGQSLSFYRGTGDARAPFAPRKKIWTPNTFNEANSLVF
ncbi:FG-GAP repeat domain-containing protein [Streptomyces sp. NPDC004284]|uniref:FG-GAP repeat domain-containing protein n=1 Tax=Streptomyces sp. NPDC004284 TaxID=3364695 RepID=UPI003688C91A